MDLATRRPNAVSLRFARAITLCASALPACASVPTSTYRDRSVLTAGARNTLALHCLDARLEVQHESFDSTRMNAFVTFANPCNGLTYIRFARVSFRCEHDDGSTEPLRWDEHTTPDTREYALDGRAVTEGRYRVSPVGRTCTNPRAVCMDLTGLVVSSDASPQWVCARVEPPDMPRSAL